MAKTDIIIHDEKDNVGVVVIDKTSKDQDCNCWIMENDKSVNIKSLNSITQIALVVLHLLSCRIFWDLYIGGQRQLFEVLVSRLLISN